MNDIDKWIYLHEKCIERALRNLLENGKLQEIIQKALEDNGDEWWVRKLWYMMMGLTE